MQRNDDYSPGKLNCLSLAPNNVTLTLNQFLPIVFSPNHHVSGSYSTSSLCLILRNFLGVEISFKFLPLLLRHDNKQVHLNFMTAEEFFAIY